MNVRRIATWSIVAAALAVAAALVGPFVLLWIGLALGPPDDMSWDDRRAYVKCEGAIADPAKWPAAPAAACRAMNMCMAEATLSAPQRAKLDAAMRQRGCT